jgi:hypothetical protein
LPSAGALPSGVLGKGLSTKILSAKISLPSAKNRHSAKSLPSAKPALGKKKTVVNSAKFEFLPRARAQHSAKKPFLKKNHFKNSLCRVVPAGTRPN